MPRERKNQKFSSIRYLNLSILSLDVVVYTCYKYKADRRVIHPTSVRRNIKLKDAVCVALFVVFCIVFCRSLFVLCSFSHCNVFPSAIYSFWFTLWYPQTFLRIQCFLMYEGIPDWVSYDSSTHDYIYILVLICLQSLICCRSLCYLFFWPLYCLSLDLRLLFTPLVSFDHCIVFL